MYSITWANLMSVPAVKDPLGAWWSRVFLGVTPDLAAYAVCRLEWTETWVAKVVFAGLGSRNETAPPTC